MEKNILYHSKSDCLSEQELIAYHDGKTDKAFTRIVELHLSECAMCSDALEGLQIIGSQDFIHENSKLQKTIDSKYSISKFLVLRPSLKWLAAASLIGIGLFFWWSNSKNLDSVTDNPTVSTPKTIENQENSSNIPTEKVLSEKSKSVAVLDQNQRNNLANTEQNDDVPTKPVENIEISSNATTSSAEKIADVEISETSKNKDEITPIAVQSETVIPQAPRANPSVPAIERKEEAKASPAAKKSKTTSEKSKANPLQNIEFAKSEEKIIQQGLDFYYKREFEKALRIFEKANELYPKSETALLYKGASQVSLDNCSDAVKTLAVFVDAYPESSEYFADAAWLTANCRVKMAEIQVARGLLTRLSEYSNSHQDEAKRLLDKLGH